MSLTLILTATVIGIIAGYLLRMIYAKSKLNSAESLAKKIISEAQAIAESKKKEALLEAKETLERERREAEQEYRERKKELISLERRLNQREEYLEKKVDILDRKEKELQEKEKQLNQKEKILNEDIASVQKTKEEQRQILEKISGMTAEEAKKILMQNYEEEARKESALIARSIEQQAIENAEKKAKEILAIAIQRVATEHTADTTTTTIPIPNDEIKGRVIGREGRNIRAFEQATGVDLIVDDTPETITISAFDPIRREIARIAMEKLLADGRIHPGRIEEVVEKVKEEMDQHIRKLGEETCLELGFTDVHPELFYYIGKLNYRTSYTQNVLLHTKEVAYLAGMMAAMLGLDEKKARRGGLMHDIGKAISHEVGGAHSKVGAEIAKRYGEPDYAINAILYHHGDEPARYPEAVLVAAADALSAARPGARREVLQSYINRLEKIEAIVNSFENVEKSFAIQAGREVRVIVNAEKLSDEEAYLLTKEIAKRIENELDFPGQIKVVTIRESRFVEVAK